MVAVSHLVVRPHLSEETNKALTVGKLPEGLYVIYPLSEENSNSSVLFAAAQNKNNQSFCRIKLLPWSLTACFGCFSPFHYVSLPYILSFKMNNSSLQRTVWQLSFLCCFIGFQWYLNGIWQPFSKYIFALLSTSVLFPTTKKQFENLFLYARGKSVLEIEAQ